MFDDVTEEELEPLILAGRLCFILANQLQSEGDSEAALRLRNRAVAQALMIDGLRKKQSNAELERIARLN